MINTGLVEHAIAQQLPVGNFLPVGHRQQALGLRATFRARGQLHTILQSGIVVVDLDPVLDLGQIAGLDLLLLARSHFSAITERVVVRDLRPVGG